MNNISVYFGKVVEVNDDEKLYRIKVQIAGKTDQIPPDELNWYYPFFGINYLPIKDDEVPILIFNNDFNSGFYNNKINLESNEYDGSEYENYLELYKRLGVQLTYNESDGIRFINQQSSVQIEDGRVSMYVEENQITLDNSRIDLGTDGEPAPLGDMTVETFNKTVNALNEMYSKFVAVFEAIEKGASSSPTKGIKAGIKATLPSAKSSIPSKISSMDNYSKTIRSEKTFIE